MEHRICDRVDKCFCTNSLTQPFHQLGRLLNIVYKSLMVIYHKNRIFIKLLVYFEPFILFYISQHTLVRELNRKPHPAKVKHFIAGHLPSEDGAFYCTGLW